MKKINLLIIGITFLHLNSTSDRNRRRYTPDELLTIRNNQTGLHNRLPEDFSHDTVRQIAAEAQERTNSEQNNNQTNN